MAETQQTDGRSASPSPEVTESRGTRESRTTEAVDRRGQENQGFAPSHGRDLLPISAATLQQLACIALIIIACCHVADVLVTRTNTPTVIEKDHSCMADTKAISDALDECRETCGTRGTCNEASDEKQRQQLQRELRQTKQELKKAKEEGCNNKGTTSELEAQLKASKAREADLASQLKITKDLLASRDEDLEEAKADADSTRASLAEATAAKEDAETARKTAEEQAQQCDIEKNDCLSTLETRANQDMIAVLRKRESEVSMALWQVCQSSYCANMYSSQCSRVL